MLSCSLCTALTFIWSSIHSIYGQQCQLTQVQFSDNGEQLYVKFSAKVDTTGLVDAAASCDPYFDALSMQYLSDSLCLFDGAIENIATTSALIVQLSNTATVQPNFESLTVVANAFSCSNVSQTALVEPPTNMPGTQIIIDDTVPTTIGSCDVFVISANASTGMTYRVYSWIWTLRFDDTETSFQTGQESQLILQPFDLPFAGEITITVQVSTYLFTQDLSIFKMTKSELPSPTVAIMGPSQWIYSEPLTFFVQLSHTACPFDDTLYIFDIECACDDAMVDAAMAQNANQFYVPSGLMAVGNSYTFTCAASSETAALVGAASSTRTVDIVSGSIIASIAGANGVHLVRNPLVLDGDSLSYSWSNIDGSIDGAHILWNCTSLGTVADNAAGTGGGRRLLQETTAYFSTTAEECACPSVVTDEATLRLPADTLGPDCVYEFAIAIDNGGAIGADSVNIATTGVGASVSIWRDSYCINENADITLIGVVSTDATSDADVSIDQYFWAETTGYLQTGDWNRVQSRLTIPSGTLVPHRTYEFSLDVSITDASQSQYAIITTSTIALRVNDEPTATSFVVTADDNNDGTIEQTYSMRAQAFSDYSPNSFQFFWRYNNASLDAADNVPLTSVISSSEVRNVYLPEGSLVITAQVIDLCGGTASITKFVEVEHSLQNITCDFFYEDIVAPLLRTAAAVKDVNRVLNVFDITVATIQRLALGQTTTAGDAGSDGSDGTAVGNDEASNATTTSTTTTTTTTLQPSTNATCLANIVDAFITAISDVIVDLDPCLQDTTILQKQLLLAIEMTGDLSSDSGQALVSIVDHIFVGCDDDGDGDDVDIPLCSELAALDTNETICVNETTLFSGILTPEKIFRGEAVSAQQISITTALMDSVLASSAVNCDDVRSSMLNIFSLLEQIVSTDFPGDDPFMIRSQSAYYDAFVQRVAPNTEVTISFEDGDSVVIDAGVTSAGRAVFRDYGNGELDSVDIFVIKIKQGLLTQHCQDVLLPNALRTDRDFVAERMAENDDSDSKNKNNIQNIRECGELLSDVYLVEIDMDGETNSLSGNVSYILNDVDEDNRCQQAIANITALKQDLTRTVNTVSYTICGHYSSSLLMSDFDDATDADSDLEWALSGCEFVERNSDGRLVCQCTHLSFHGVSSIHLIEELGIPSLLEVESIFYIILLGFGIIAVISLFQMILILFKGFCKLEPAVLIYYMLFLGSIFQGMSIYFASRAQSADLDQAYYEQNAYLSFDVVTSSVRFVVLCTLLNTWFRIKGGKKPRKSLFKRWALNILILTTIVYDVVCVVMQMSQNRTFDNIFVVGTLVVNLASGSLAVFWSLSKCILCIRRLKKKEKAVKKVQGYVRTLFIMLICITIGLILQTMLTLFATTEYFQINSDSLPYVSQWRLINYAIDIAIWFVILLFYVCIYVKSSKKMRGNPSQAGALFKADIEAEVRRDARKRPDFVEESESRDHGRQSVRPIHISQHTDDNAMSPDVQSRWRSKSKKRDRKQDRADRAQSSSIEQPPPPMGGPPDDDDHHAPMNEGNPWVIGSAPPRSAII